MSPVVDGLTVQEWTGLDVRYDSPRALYSVIEMTDAIFDP